MCVYTYLEQLQSLDSKKSQRRKCLPKIGSTVIRSRRSPQNIISLSKLPPKFKPLLLLPSFHYFGSLIDGKQRRPQIKVKHHIFGQSASKVTPFLFLQVIRISSFENLPILPQTKHLYLSETLLHTISFHYFRSLSFEKNNIDFLFYK